MAGCRSRNVFGSPFLYEIAVICKDYKKGGIGHEYRKKAYDRTDSSGKKD